MRNSAGKYLTDLEEKFRLLTEYSLAGIYIMDPAGKILYANRRLAEISGYSPAELEGRNIFQLVHPDDREGIIEQASRKAAGRPAPRNWSCRGIRKDGSVGWLEGNSVLITYEGSPALFGNFIEVTESKLAYAALQESEERLRTLIDATPDCIFFKDAEGRWLVANRAALSLFELDGFDYRGRTDRELAGVNEFYREAFLTCLETDRKAWEKGSLYREEETIPRPDGPPVVLDVIKVPLFFPDGSRKALVVLGRDITRNKNSESLLRQAAKLETVGTLSLSIAHEFNNILMGISGNAELAAGETGDSPLVKKALSTILRLTRRAGTMIQRLGTFGRREKINPRPTEVTAVIDEALALHDRDLKLANIAVEKSYPGPVRVAADASQLEQVFVNLILNAYHALLPGEKGKISVEVREKNREVEIRISDDGIGIPEEQLPRIFEPFFTTKTEGREEGLPGLGLGLWVSRQIVEDHGGRIEAARRPEGGTAFTLTLPRLSRTPQSEAEARPAADSRFRVLKGKKILVIDDEEDLLVIFSKYLAGHGLEVTTADNGEEGLRHARRREFDIFLVDYVMPGLSGTALIRKLRAAAPRARIVVISGKRLPEELAGELGGVVDDFLRKPLELLQLGERLARLI